MPRLLPQQRKHLPHFSKPIPSCLFFWLISIFDANILLLFVSKLWKLVPMRKSAFRTTTHRGWPPPLGNGDTGHVPLIYSFDILPEKLCDYWRWGVWGGCKFCDKSYHEETADLIYGGDIRKSALMFGKFLSFLIKSWRLIRYWDVLGLLNWRNAE